MLNATGPQGYTASKAGEKRRAWIDGKNNAARGGGSGETITIPTNLGRTLDGCVGKLKNWGDPGHNPRSKLSRKKKRVHLR